MAGACLEHRKDVNEAGERECMRLKAAFGLCSLGFASFKLLAHLLILLVTLLTQLIYFPYKLNKIKLELNLSIFKILK